MPKQGEIDYVRKLAPHEVAHAQGKPFSDPRCGHYLMDLGLVLQLLPPPPARVLDLGVGAGWTSLLLGQRGYHVVGVDLAPDMIELAMENREHHAAAAVEFLVADYETLAFAAEFDAVLFYDALHHAEDEQTALARAHRALRENGICITVEPGAGHADDAGARRAVERFGVTEKSMPPRHIIDLGRRVGFRRFEVFERPTVRLLERCPDSGWRRNTRRALRALVKDCWHALGARRRNLTGSHVVVLHR